ncbi:hypothetical protein ACYOEI_28435 [Singulisphaera rosea]
MASEDPILELSKKLGKERPAILAAIASSSKRRRSLEAALERFTSEDTSIVVFGSLARQDRP